MTPALAVYTAGVIVAGFGLLAVATLAYPIGPAIGNLRLPGLGGDPSLMGIAFWSALGLLGSTRATVLANRSILTFHLPFIVAAMTLGGPVAGGWVAAIATIERREIRDVPWFGTLANHAILAGAAVVGGLVVAPVHAIVGSVADPQVATFVSAVAAGFVFCAIDLGLTVVTVGLREQLSPTEAVGVFDRSFRQTTLAEVVLGWLLALGYAQIGPWAPIVCAVLVLLVWQADDEHELTTHDAMTGLLNRRGFEARWAPTLRRVRRGRQRAALVMVDLDGFKGINDRLGHETGDEVLRAIGDRLRRAIRLTDAAARLGGDEFALLLVGVRDARSAADVVARIHRRLCDPIQLAGRTVSVGASLGLVYLDDATAADGLAEADAAMYHAKRRGGGVELARASA